MLRVALVKLILVSAVLSAGGFSVQQTRSERRTLGDTTIVLTTGAGAEAGLRRVVPVLSFGQVNGPPEYTFGNVTDLRRGPDGSIVVFDRQVRALRKYDSTGRFLHDIGRNGQGPGEYMGATGIAILPNGSTVLSDIQNDRITIWGATGQLVSMWDLSDAVGPYDDPVVRADTAGNVWLEVIEDPVGSQVNMPKTVFRRLDANGRVVDSIVVNPRGSYYRNLDYRAVNGRQVRVQLPFEPVGRYAWSNRGQVVTTATARYSLDIIARSGTLTRIERDLPAIPVSQPERDEAVRIINERIRRVEPSYNFSGQIPRTHPALKDVYTDDDGRIWAFVSLPAERIPEAERLAAANRFATMAGRQGFGATPGSPTRDWGTDYDYTFRMPIAFDVYSPDGRFLGRVSMPTGVLPNAMKGDFVWAVTRDSLDVQKVTKFRVEPALGR